MLLCQLAVSIPCVLVLLAILVISPGRQQHPKYWVALACVGQPIPLAFVLREMGPFSNYFEVIWLISMAFVLVGLVVLIAWPIREG